MQLTSTPFFAHVFICTNDRNGVRKSCADSNGAEIRARLKEIVGQRGWKRWIRVSQAGCLGKCAEGPNVMIYPQGLWFSEVSLDDLDDIVNAIQQIVSNLQS